MGRAMLRFMNLTHAPLTNWGLGLIEFQDGWTMLDVGCGGGKTLSFEYCGVGIFVVPLQRDFDHTAKSGGTLAQSKLFALGLH